MLGDSASNAEWMLRMGIVRHLAICQFYFLAKVYLVHGHNNNFEVCAQAPP